MSARKGPTSAKRSEEQGEMLGRQRIEAGHLAAEHTRQLADLISRQDADERDLEKRHRRELARMWRNHGRKVGPWMALQLAPIAAAKR